MLRIAAYGLPQERPKGEEELLIACLVPYVGDNNLHYAAEREIANVAARKYPHLYQAVGEHCLAEKVPDDPDPKLLIGELSTELPTAGACLAGIVEYPPHAPTMDNSPWYFTLPPIA